LAHIAQQPQGSVLGPVLFIIFVNDIGCCVSDSVKLKLFADDSKIYTVLDDTNASSCLQSCIENIRKWSEQWQLQLSPIKCTAIHLSPVRSVTKPVNYFYSIGDVVLPFVDTCTSWCYLR